MTGLALVEMLALAGPEELEALAKALAHEQAMREVMADTGESREIVQSVVGAMDSMQQEAVLELTDGNPTTLRAALDKYVDGLFDRSSGPDPSGDDIRDQEIGRELTALLNYPWPDRSC